MIHIDTINYAIMLPPCCHYGNITFPKTNYQLKIQINDYLIIMFYTQIHI
jgi:hypothetical protein